MKKYILVDGKPVEEPNIIKWAEWFETAERQIELNIIGDVCISRH